nr:glycosyltransferase [Limosilactobacillus mucosae]
MNIEKKDLISIIVPVYNCNQFLSYCVESLLSQSYKNLEILLVDDGSTDNSGKICDSYSNNYKFIHTIHQKNEGLSAARNTGIENAKGEWVLFVDGDDVVSPYLCEMALFNCQITHSDLCLFNFCEFYGSKGFSFNKENFNTLENLEILSNEKAMELLLDDEVGSYAWNKFYNMKLLKKIRYPVGRNYEDIGTTYKFVNVAHKIIYLKYSLYGYRQNPNGIMHHSNVKNINDAFQMRQQQKIFFLKNYPRIFYSEKFQFELIYISLQECLYSFDSSEYREEYAQAISNVKASRIIKGLSFSSRLTMFLIQKLYPIFILEAWIFKLKRYLLLKLH